MGVAIDIVEELPTSAAGEAVSRRYYEDIIGRFYGRPATPQEVADTQNDYPSGSLVAPNGTFLVARIGTAVVGCAGMRLVDDVVGEVTRVFVEQSVRGGGVGRSLLERLEHEARQLGLRQLRLDTRADLVEARGLYASVGYRETPAHNSDPYADHWFLKELY